MSTDGGTTWTDVAPVEGYSYPYARERLMLALIGTLVDDLRGGNPRQKTEVRSYLAHEGASEVFGFRSICSHFGWPEGHVRRELAKIAARPGERQRWRSYAG